MTEEEVQAAKGQQPWIEGMGLERQLASKPGGGRPAVACAGQRVW